MVEPTESKKWSCKCGTVNVKLRGEPYMLFNCHCHSCVAVMRHLDAQPNPGTSAQAGDDNPGAAKAFYFLRDVEFSAPPEEVLGFFKVGDKGGNVRTYTKCCGTLMNTSGGSIFPTVFRPFNRNCITNEDGTRYQPPAGHAVPNVNVRAAFDKDAVPEPKYEEASWGILWGFVLNMLSMKLFGKGGAGDLADDPALWKKGSDPDVEVVPITWE